jgi:hypothetical protein
VHTTDPTFLIHEERLLEANPQVLGLERLRDLAMDLQHHLRVRRSEAVHAADMPHERDQLSRMFARKEDR